MVIKQIYNSNFRPWRETGKMPFIFTNRRVTQKSAQQIADMLSSPKSRGFSLERTSTDREIRKFESREKGGGHYRSKRKKVTFAWTGTVPATTRWGKRGRSRFAGSTKVSCLVRRSRLVLAFPRASIPGTKEWVPLFHFYRLIDFLDPNFFHHL